MFIYKYSYLNLDDAMHDKDGKSCNQHKKNTHIGIVEANAVFNHKPLCYFVTIFFSSDLSESAILCAWKYTQNGSS